MAVIWDGPAEESREIERLKAEAILRDERIAALVEEVEHLHAAMDSRSVIEQAKGVLMSTMRISHEAAFAVLVAASQRENIKLRDVAARITAAQARRSPRRPPLADRAGDPRGGGRRVG